MIMMIEESSMKSLKIVEKDFWFYGLIKESQPYINKGGSLSISEPPFIMSNYVNQVFMFTGCSWKLRQVNINTS